MRWDNLKTRFFRIPEGIVSGCCLLLLMATVPAISFAQGEKFRGWIVGERCAQGGKIGECYLKWAYPLVLWTGEKKTYMIEIVDEDLGMESLDKAFGKEVEMEGWVAEGHIMVMSMKVLEATGKREFFKG